MKDARPEDDLETRAEPVELIRAEPVLEDDTDFVPLNDLIFVRDPCELDVVLILTEFDVEGEVDALEELLALLKPDDEADGDCETESSVVRVELGMAE